MSDESTDLTAFKQRLAEVPPNPGRFERDALLFAAGRAAGRRGRFWPVAAAAMALLSAGLGAVLVLRPPTAIEIERVVIVSPPNRSPTPEPGPSAQQESPSPVSAPLASEWIEGVRLRERVLRDGVGATPSPVWAAAPLAAPSDIPDLSALRLNASPTSGEPLP
jgi:hypothetical protein